MPKLKIGVLGLRVKLKLTYLRLVWAVGMPQNNSEPQNKSACMSVCREELTEIISRAGILFLEARLAALIRQAVQSYRFEGTRRWSVRWVFSVHYICFPYVCAKLEFLGVAQEYAVKAMCFSRILQLGIKDAYRYNIRAVPKTSWRINPTTNEYAFAVGKMAQILSQSPCAGIGILEGFFCANERA